jgi:hypothetical protein
MAGPLSCSLRLTARDYILHFCGAAANWNPKSELWRGDALNVTLSRCPDGILVAVKTAGTTQDALSIQQEAEASSGPGISRVLPVAGELQFGDCD